MLIVLILTLLSHAKENTFPNSPRGAEGKNYGQTIVYVMLHLKTILKPACRCDPVSNPALLSQAQAEGVALQSGPRCTAQGQALTHY